MPRTQKTAVIPFFLLVFALSIPFWILDIIHPVQLLPGIPLSALSALTPALAALILTFWSDRHHGVLQLLKRSVDVKQFKNKAWFLLVLLINPAIAIFAYAVLNTSKTLPPAGPWTLSILPLFASFFVFALFEELGWTGYATEPLLERKGTLITGLLLGSVWAVWHWVPLVQVQRSPEWIFWWSLNTISARMIMVWLYRQAGKSVFAATLYHAMLNLCWQLFPINGSYYDPRLFGLVTFGLMIVLYAIPWLRSAFRV